MKKIALVFALALALSFGLASCGGAPKEDFTPNFAGTWELIQVEGGDNSLSQDDFVMLKDLGMSCTLNLAEDGTYTFDMFGDVSSDAWEAVAADTATLTMSGQSVNVTLANDTLTLEQGGSEKLVFSKAGAAAAAESSTAESSAASSEEAAAEDEAAASSAA